MISKWVLIKNEVFAYTVSKAWTGDAGKSDHHLEKFLYDVSKSHV